MPKSQKELAAEAKREYMKRWRAQNKDKVRRYNENFWLRKAEQLKGNDDARCNNE